MNDKTRQALRDRLKKAEAAVERARTAKAAAERDFDEKAQAYTASNDTGDISSPTFRAAKAAREARDAAATALQDAQDVRAGILQMLSDEGPAAPGAARLPSTDDKQPGAWLSRVIVAAGGGGGPMAVAAPFTTDELGSVTENARMFFDRLTPRSAILSTPGVAVVDIDTTSVKVGRLAGRMTPAVPVPELEPIPKDDVPITDAEVEPPKWPKLVTLSLEAYRDARPLRLRVVESEMIRAIGEGFDASCFHGTTAEGHTGMAETVGVAAVSTGAKNERQSITQSGASAGTLTLTFGGQTTAGIAYNATAAAVKTALEALSSIDVGDVLVTGGPFGTAPVVVEFTGAHGQTDVAAITADSTGLTGGTVTIATTQAGKPMTNLDWVADAAGSLLAVNAEPRVVYINPYTVRALLKLKKGTDSNEPLTPEMLREAGDLLGVRPKITSAVQNGHAFMVDPRELLVVRRQDVETRVFEDYGFDNAEVGIRAIARMQLEIAHPEAVVHITDLPTP